MASATREATVLAARRRPGARLRRARRSERHAGVRLPRHAGLLAQFADATTRAAALGVRLIAPDRPGYGAATTCPTGGCSTGRATSRRSRDHLGLAHFGVFGVSGGGPHAAVCAHRSRRGCSARRSCAAWRDAHGTRTRDGMMPVNRLISRLARRSQWLVLAASSRSMTSPCATSASAWCSRMSGAAARARPARARAARGRAGVLPRGRRARARARPRARRRRTSRCSRARGASGSRTSRCPSTCSAASST